MDRWDFFFNWLLGSEGREEGGSACGSAGSYLCAQKSAHLAATRRTRPAAAGSPAARPAYNTLVRRRYKRVSFAFPVQETHSNIHRLHWLTPGDPPPPHGTTGSDDAPQGNQDLHPGAGGGGALMGGGASGLGRLFLRRRRRPWLHRRRNEFPGAKRRPLHRAPGLVRRGGHKTW